MARPEVSQRLAGSDAADTARRGAESRCATTPTSLGELWVPGGSEHWRWVRCELFIFRDVRDVLGSPDRDRVLIVHRGRAQPERWLHALSDAGLDQHERHDAVSIRGSTPPQG